MVSRLRLRHALPVAETLDHCGFAALDVFGGSTFEASLRFLAEDPFERLRAIRAAAPITPFLAVIGGQSLVGHRQVPDDLVDAFIETSAAAGVDIFRCYDPLNDVRNLERCAIAIAAHREAGGGRHRLQRGARPRPRRPRRRGPQARRRRLPDHLPARSARRARRGSSREGGQGDSRGRGCPGGGVDLRADRAWPRWRATRPRSPARTAPTARSRRSPAVRRCPAPRR